MSLADDLIHAVERESVEGLRLAAEAVLEEAQRNVPVGDPKVDPDPNVTLKDSGHIEHVQTPYGDIMRVEFDTPYAAKVHEDLRLKHPRGGEAKYLENAVKNVSPRLAGIVASKVDARTAKGMLSNPRRHA